MLCLHLLPYERVGQSCLHHNLGRNPTWGGAQRTQPNRKLVSHPCDFTMLHHGFIVLCHKGFEKVEEI
jgi:hypothetical protein